MAPFPIELVKEATASRPRWARHCNVSLDTGVNELKGSFIDVYDRNLQLRQVKMFTTPLNHELVEGLLEDNNNDGEIFEGASIVVTIDEILQQQRPPHDDGHGGGGGGGAVAVHPNDNNNHNDNNDARRLPANENDANRIAGGGGPGEEDRPELEAINTGDPVQQQPEVDKQMTNSSDNQSGGGGGGSNSSLLNLSSEEKEMEVDARSVYVGNVDYGATTEELEQHFHGCGSINRVTILRNKSNGLPNGFACVEFTDKDSVSAAMSLNESLFRGRQIKVFPKRTNKPGIGTTLPSGAPEGSGAEDPSARSGGVGGEA